jgi:hypothetical protein
MRLLTLLVLMLLPGCASTGDNEVALKMLSNLERCERHYTLGLGIGATGSLVIHCPAK